MYGMTVFEYGQNEDERRACVPEGVLKGVEDVIEGRTMSNEQFNDVLDF
jgi:hypothetical protein